MVSWLGYHWVLSSKLQTCDGAWSFVPFHALPTNYRSAIFLKTFLSIDMPHCLQIMNTRSPGAAATSNKRASRKAIETRTCIFLGGETTSIPFSSAYFQDSLFVPVSPEIPLLPAFLSERKDVR